ncbi:protein-glutamate methylesterase/protein-glutamine glutaminase [Thermovenabulum gondwanense]|uniref:Protein-glutamate methylesterase/protein-glutamine glutaminase n=1 Tax=Thermovenabulum gondwanense TaxID=520767 RepID=A0A161QCI9_9FIRM|nr:chemotaxis response regulator protein-glutamate methylesterase [Thermovenabulum gondwanense]KYO66968.1 Chemotaxis response regulator protein-glutamate methylesterase [Thermovenabulum gondwanense]
MIKVLVADDSALMRLMIKDILESDPEIKVIDTARNGKDAVEKARKLKPDVITMDVNMPEMDGLEALKIIKEEKLGRVIMLSSITREGADITLKALESGAFDFIPKPGGSISINLKDLSEEIIEKVKAAAKNGFRELSMAIREKRDFSDIKYSTSTSNSLKAVVIGISTGGPKNIMEVLPYIPPDINAAIFLIQHMPPAFTNQFAKRLNESCKIKVVEAEDKMKVEKGVCYVGKGGYNLLLEGDKNSPVINLTDYPKHRFMPSADVAMNSILQIFGEDTIGVLMTGMGSDGAEAMVKIRKAGGRTIAESEETAVIFGMPRAAIEKGGAEFVLPNYKIAEKIVELAGLRK